MEIASGKNEYLTSHHIAHCETGLPSSVFQAVHEISLILLFKVVNYLSSVGLSGMKQVQLVSRKVEFTACQVSLLAQHLLSQHINF